MSFAINLNEQKQKKNLKWAKTEINLKSAKTKATIANAIKTTMHNDSDLERMGYFSISSWKICESKNRSESYRNVQNCLWQWWALNLSGCWKNYVTFNYFQFFLSLNKTYWQIRDIHTPLTIYADVFTKCLKFCVNFKIYDFNGFFLEEKCEWKLREFTSLFQWSWAWHESTCTIKIHAQMIMNQH